MIANSINFKRVGSVVAIVMNIFFLIAFTYFVIIANIIDMLEYRMARDFQAVIFLFFPIAVALSFFIINFNELAGIIKQKYDGARISLIIFVLVVVYIGASILLGN